MKVICVHRLSSIEEKIFLPKIPLSIAQHVRQESIRSPASRASLSHIYQLLHTSWMAVVSTGFYCISFLFYHRFWVHIPADSTLGARGLSHALISLILHASSVSYFRRSTSRPSFGRSAFGRS